MKAAATVPRRHPTLVLARRCGWQDASAGLYRPYRWDSEQERGAYVFAHKLWYNRKSQS